jgi:hypothetical protein
MRTILVSPWAFFFLVTFSTSAWPGKSPSLEEQRTVLATPEDDDKPDTDTTYPLDQLETGTHGVFPGMESEDNSFQNAIPEGDEDTPEEDLERIEE